VVQLRRTNVQTTRTECASCHFKEAKYENNEMHTRLNVQCVDCHMPRVVKNAVGDAERFQGDLRSHLVAIDPDQIEQFTEDGRFSIPVLSLNFACKSCHNPEGAARPRSDEELQANAFNYHARPQPAVLVPAIEEEAESEE
jgi:formate-dependent nitrite reductase cytochrome c552 subunit